MVLQNIMTKATMQNCTLGWSRVRNETAAPIMHIIPTLYTLIPMYLLSFKAGMLTFRVSQARKHPNNWNGKRRKRGDNYKRNWLTSRKSINFKLVFSNLTNIGDITIQRCTPTFYSISNYLHDLFCSLGQIPLTRKMWNLELVVMGTNSSKCYGYLYFILSVIFKDSSFCLFSRIPGKISALFF